MKKKDAMEWVEALRSGNYKQGRYLLHNTVDNTYCCLGVLADIKKLCPSNPYSLCNTDKKPIFLKTSDGRLFTNDPDYKSVDLAILNDAGYNENPGTNPLNFDEITDIIQICYKDL